MANRGKWLDDAEGWREETRDVEDRLSEALHERLTQRFVDRRTSVLMRRLKQKERLVAEVNDKGEVSVEGHFVGRLDGFRFTVDESASEEEVKTLRSASLVALQAEFARRADKLYISPDTELEVTEQGGLMWGTDAVGRLEKGDSPLAPKVTVFVDDMAEPTVAEKVERRLGHWITRRINTQFEPLLAMQVDETVTGLARGVAFQVAEAMGVVPRRQVANDVKALGQDERGLLRKHGVRFGQHNIFMPLLLKPAPTRLRLILWSLWEGFEVFPEAPPPGLVTIPAAEGAPDGYYEKVGYRLCGQRALRIDMLERLADLLRPMDVRGGFEATPDMLSITGCTLEQFADILGSLGFRGERGERPKPERPKVPEAPEPPSTEGTPEASAEAPEPDPESAADEPAGDPAETPPEPAQEAEAAVGADTADPAPVEGEPEAAQGDAPAESGEPVESEIEVYYTFRLKPRPRPGGQGSRRGAGGPGKNGPGNVGQGAKRKFSGKKGGPKGKGPRPPREDAPAKPKRPERGPDPDSPFAILQQLKDK